MPGGTLLEIVDDGDAVIGVRSREEIHTLGLRHREVHVWLVTPDNDIIFQRRSPTKGHVSGPAGRFCRRARGGGAELRASCGNGG